MWMHDNKTILLHLEARVITWRKCNDFYFLFNTIKYILCTLYAYFGNFSCPNSTKVAITWPVIMATRFKSHKSETGFWLFALKDTFWANFIKIGDYRFPPILEILRSLQRSHFNNTQLKLLMGRLGSGKPVLLNTQVGWLLSLQLTVQNWSAIICNQVFTGVFFVFWSFL